MRVLFICQFFAPDITAAAFRMSDFARLLAEMGEDVQVITSYPHKASITDVDDSVFTTAGVRVHRCRLPKIEGTGARPYLRHYFAFVRGSLSLGWKIWRSGWKPDVIYASSPPLFVGLSGRILSLLFWKPMAFEVRDIWPDAAVSAGQLSAGGMAYRLGQRLERYVYRKADHLICVAQPMRDYLLPLASVPVTVIYNGISTDVPWFASRSSQLSQKEAESAQSASQMGSPDGATAPHDSTPPATTAAKRQRTILYAGNLGHVQQLDLLIAAMSQLVKSPEMDNWRIQLLGAGAQSDNLKNLAGRLGLTDRIDFLGAVPQAEAARRMRQADLLYLHLMHDKTMARTIPSKLFDYLLAERPIVGGLAGEGRELLKSTGANVVFEPGQEDALKAAILQAVRELPECAALAHRNRELVLRRFTRRAAADRLHQVLTKVSGKTQ